MGKGGFVSGPVISSMNSRSCLLDRHIGQPRALEEAIIDCRALASSSLPWLSRDIRRAVREEARRELGDIGESVKPEAEYRIVSGRC